MKTFRIECPVRAGLGAAAAADQLIAGAWGRRHARQALIRVYGVSSESAASRQLAVNGCFPL
jgi:hypothetical protein